ncbi:hypothetical protein PVAG01_06462 [Phlyctema vagabunda]|uniref:Uncharacterized protein n=1 Tax=Phlyctema vagabunda TaxID=108571 RepID=A0ABR4PG37_9HELO
MSSFQAQTAAAISSIRPFVSLKLISTPPHIQARFSVGRHFTVTNNAMHELPSNHIFDRVMNRWAQRTDPLWWSSVAFIKASSHRVVRSYMSRRVRLAWIESMRKQGWARDGSRLPGSKQQADLVGTLQMNAMISVLKLSPEELERTTDTILQTVIQIAQKGPVTNPRRRKWNS